MPLINGKVELKLRWTKHCVLALSSVENDSNDSNNVIFNTKDTTLYVPAFTLWVSSKGFKSSKGYKNSVYWNKHKTKGENKTSTNSIDIFWNHILPMLTDFWFSLFE